MIKYAKIINEETKECNVGMGSNIDFYKKIGMEQLDVEQAYNGRWYLSGYAPEQPPETLQEKLERLEREYQMPRYVREGILVENSPYSDFTKGRAQELENIAKQIRDENVEKENNPLDDY